MWRQKQNICNVNITNDHSEHLKLKWRQDSFRLPVATATADRICCGRARAGRNLPPGITCPPL